MSRYWIRSLYLALAYFCTGYLGLLMPAVGTAVTMLWLPTGISVAFLFRAGYGYLPAVSVGSCLVNLAAGQGWMLAIGISVGNTLAPLVAVWFLHKLGFHHQFERIRDIVYLSLAAFLGMLVSASGGVFSLVLSGALTDGILKAWLCWWAGDSMGVIAAAPLLLVATRSGLDGIRDRGLEFFAWLVATSLIVAGVFLVNGDVNQPAWPLAFLPLPLIVWATMRFGPTGTSLAVILISLGAVYGTSIRSGPFYQPYPAEQILLLWMYMATAATMGWLISSLRLAQVRAAGIQRVLELALAEASLGVLITDADRRITYANEGFAKLTGYQEADLLGGNCRWLQGEKTDPATVVKLKSDLDHFGHFDGEILNYHKNGTPFWNALLVITLNDENGKRIGFLGIQRDVSAKKEAEVALQESELRLRTILNLEPECVKIISADGGLLEMNPAGLAMIEADSIEQVRGCRLEDLIESDYQIVFRRTHQAILAGETGQCEFAIRGLKGTRRWLESHAVPYRNLHGEIVGQLSVTRDITERRERELLLANERTMFELLATGAPLDHLLQRLALHNELVCSEMVCSVLLLDEQEGVLRNVAAPHLPEAWLHATEGLRIGPWAGSCGTAAYTRQRVIVSDIASDFRWRDHRELALSCGLRACWSFPMISSQGRVLGTLAVYSAEARSPTEPEIAAIERGAYFAVLAVERHQLLASLRDSQRKLETLIANLPGMAYRCQNDARRTMSYVSAGCERVTGFAADELVQMPGLNYSDLIHPDDREWLWGQSQASLAAGLLSSHTYRIRDKSGQIRWVLERASGVYADDGSLLCIDGFVQDITESRSIEDQVRASLREKEAMLKEIHHRVKNNLQIISSLLNLQVETVTDTGTLAALRGSQNRIRSMAMIHESLYQSGNLGKIDLSEYVGELCRHLFRSYGIDASVIHLSLSVAHATLDLERAIPFGLIINELVSNALKYAFPDGRSGRIDVRFGIAQENCYILSVCDDGTGLPTSLDLKRLRSLGLQLVQDLIQQLSGTLAIHQTPHTEFLITFPLFSSDHGRVT